MSNEMSNETINMPVTVCVDDVLLATAQRQFAALEAARHALTSLHGLVAHDDEAPGETFAIDESATIALIDAALGAAPAPDPAPDPAPAWLPWPDAEGLWWMRFRSGIGSFFVRAVFRAGEMTVESFGSSNVDRRTPYSILLEFASATVGPEPR